MLLVRDVNGVQVNLGDVFVNNLIISARSLSLDHVSFFSRLLWGPGLLNKPNISSKLTEFRKLRESVHRPWKWNLLLLLLGFFHLVMHFCRIAATSPAIRQRFSTSISRAWKIYRPSVSSLPSSAQTATDWTVISWHLERGSRSSLFRGSIAPSRRNLRCRSSVSSWRISVSALAAVISNSSHARAIRSYSHAYSSTFCRFISHYPYEENCAKFACYSGCCIFMYCWWL